MIKTVKISNFREVKEIVAAASDCVSDIGVHDVRGGIADAKSLLGLMSLDFSEPVQLVSESIHDLTRVYRALAG
ncbi:MAG: HPr family phosphocarrier protein [Oscillospiraceae bacterium]|nr:HPr family phosphocarrier protein [Oscillospiraceae bacterium]